MELLNIFRTRGGILKYIQNKRWNSSTHSGREAEFFKIFRTKEGILKYIQDKEVEFSNIFKTKDEF